MKTGIELIAEERQRQIDVEKWDYSHDADYANGELIMAAGCYAASALSRHLEDKLNTNQSPLAKFQVYDFGERDFFENAGDRGDRMIRAAGWVDAWPWDSRFDKRKKHNKIRSLVIAGSLIAAELDRLNTA